MANKRTRTAGRATTTKGTTKSTKVVKRRTKSDADVQKEDRNPKPTKTSKSASTKPSRGKKTESGKQARLNNLEEEHKQQETVKKRLVQKTSETVGRTDKSTSKVMDPRKKLLFTPDAATPGPSNEQSSKRRRSSSAVVVVDQFASREPQPAQLYEPPPKRYRPLQPEDLIDDVADDFAKLEALYYEQVRDTYSDLESIMHGSQSRKQTAHIRCLAGPWTLYTVAKFYRFMFSDKNESLKSCLKKLRTKLYEHLCQNKKLRQRYSQFVVEVHPYLGFEPFTTDRDEPAYGIRIVGKTPAGSWEENCYVIMGSLGTHGQEATFAQQGEQFSFYPFILARGDSEVLPRVFEYFKKHDAGRSGAVLQIFSREDMWRLLTLCLFFVQRIPRRGKHDHKNVRLKVAEELGIEITWDFDMSSIMKDIRKREDYVAGNGPHFMTEEQVELTKSAVTEAYQRQFQRDWSPTAVSVLSIEMPSVSVSNFGALNFRAFGEAVSFLFFFSRYRIRTYLHPTLGITAEQIWAEREFSEEEQADKQAQH